MNNTKQTNNNTEDSFSERQDVTCNEGEAVTKLSQSSGSPSDDEIVADAIDFAKTWEWAGQQSFNS